MGLDIWLYSFKDLKTLKKYETITKKFNRLYEKFYKKHKKILDLCYSLQTRFEELCYELDINPSYNPYSIRVYDVLENDEERKLYSDCENENNEIKKEKHDILADLNFRKNYWFIQWVYSKNVKSMKFSSDFNCCIADNNLTITKSDIKEIVDKLDYIIKNAKTIKSNDDFIEMYLYDKAEFEKVFPINHDYKFSVRYDWLYGKDYVNGFYVGFKEYYDKMEDKEIVLVSECW